MVYRYAETDTAPYQSVARFVAALIKTIIRQKPMQKEDRSDIRPLASPC